MRIKEFSLKWELISCIGFFIAVSAFVLAYSPVVQLKWAHDIAVVLDGAWRIQNGQIPHRDFSSILGYCFLYQHYLFLKLFNYDFIAIAVSTAVLSTVLVAIYLSFYRSKAFIANTNIALRLYMFLLIVALGLGQYLLGWFVYDLTYACLYNRYCFECLLLVILILCLLSGKDKITKTSLLLLAITSLLLIYLLFSKITFFIAAGSIIVLFLFLKYLSFNYFKYLLLFSLIVFFAFLVVSGENFILLLEDYKSISDIRTTAFFDIYFFAGKFWGRYNVILILSYGYLLFQLIQKKAASRIIIVFLFVAAMSVFLHFTNFGNFDVVFLTFIPVFFFLSDFIPYRKLLSFKIMLLACSIFIYKNLRSIALTSTAKSHIHTELKSKNLRHFYSWYIVDSCNLEYASRFEDGLKLIDKNIKPGEKIMSFTYESLFPLLTHTVPPKNVILVWQDGMTYSKTHYPDSSILFSDVNVLMIPKCVEEEAINMSKTYAATVREKFTKVDESDNWIFYRKNLGAL